MKQFLACVKKEWLEATRTKKVALYAALAFGMLVMSLAVVFLMSWMFELEGLADAVPEVLGSMYQKTYSTGVMMFISLLITYFFIMVVVFNMKAVSKEIKEKKWTVPVASGIKPENMIGAKILVTTAIVAGTLVLSFILHFIVMALFFEKDIAVSNVILQYVICLVGMIFVTIMTISINAITKKTWASVVVPLVLVIVVSALFGGFEIAGVAFVNYTPLFFMSGTAYFDFAWYVWLSNCLSMVVTLALLVFFAVRASKITASNLSEE